MVWERFHACCPVHSLFECGVAMVMQHPLQWLYSVANMETCEIQMLGHCHIPAVSFMWDNKGTTCTEHVDSPCSLYGETFYIWRLFVAIAEEQMYTMTPANRQVAEVACLNCSHIAILMFEASLTAVITWLQMQT